MQFRTERDTRGERQVPPGDRDGLRIWRAEEDGPVSGVTAPPEPVAPPQVVETSVEAHRAVGRLHRPCGDLPGGLA